MIREGRPGDWPRLRLIQQVTLDEPWPELLEASLDGPPLVLVVETDRPIGYALVVPDEPVAYLAEFAIAPDHQGEGFGTRLMKTLLERLANRGVETVRLTARADDEPVYDFYEGHGFSVVDRIPDNYETCDGLVFAREL